MYIVAVFVGEHGSMGLEWNKTYRLKIRPHIPMTPDIVEVVDTYPRVKIPYNSLHAFFRNWIVVGSFGETLPSNSRNPKR